MTFPPGEVLVLIDTYNDFDGEKEHISPPEDQLAFLEAHTRLCVKMVRHCHAAIYVAGPDSKLWGEKCYPQYSALHAGYRNAKAAAAAAAGIDRKSVV